MEQVRNILEEVINEQLLQIILSNSICKDKIQKIKVRPVLLKEQLQYQITLYKGTQVFHENYAKNEAVDALMAQFEMLKQCEIETKFQTIIILISKKGKITIKRKQKVEPNLMQPMLEHNRKKTYLLEEGLPVDFLIKLGVQTKEGKIINSMQDKFRQINRYLEFVEDIMGELPTNRPIKIIDFGCGKSYLTFALYYYLHEVKKREVEIIGLDLKTSVIELCNKLAKEFGYEHLKFERGDISTYEGATDVDMVVSLHACDVATDYALHKAVLWGAKVIMAVPCCQHELNGQMQYEPMQSLFKYGIIKERMAALMTDAIRANLLEEQGYSTQILEFIDMAHTPKNLLIRAVKKSSKDNSNNENLAGLLGEMQARPTLAQLLEDVKKK